MADDRPFGIYLSHSWRAGDIGVNLQVWEALANEFELLVDSPEEPTENPPYYVHRIEELLRRSDAFVCILTFRDGPNSEFEGEESSLRCSPYSLFEIRLAEQIDIPRLVLFERSTRFRAPASRPWEVYIPFDREAGSSRIEDRQWHQVAMDRISRWKDWILRHRRPASYEQSTSAAVLASDSGSLFPLLRACAQDAGFDCQSLSIGEVASGSSIRTLRSLGLLFADFRGASERHLQVYAVAHALGLPSIRMVSTSGRTDAPALPWILQGYPGGYQHDVLTWHSLDDIEEQVRPRLRVLTRISPAMQGQRAVSYLQSKRFSGISVFLSHSLKPPHRALVDRLFQILRENHVPTFEYHRTNTASIDWRDTLRKSLSDTTHLVVLLSDGYEQSPTCTFELEEILSRGEAVTILPYMIGGRSAPHPKLTALHHGLLDQADPDRNALIVAEQVLAVLAAQREARGA